jgi:NAD(P)H-dependent FMN reductase
MPHSVEAVVQWAIDRAFLHGSFEVEVIHLSSYDFSLVDDGAAEIRLSQLPAPVIHLTETLAEADAFLVISPEYRRSVPCDLKAVMVIGSLAQALRNKPIACFGYHGGRNGGTRAMDQLAHLAVNNEMVPLRRAIVLPGRISALESGDPHEDVSAVSLNIMLDDLSWWSTVLMRGRNDGELPPASERVITALRR